MIVQIRETQVGIPTTTVHWTEGVGSPDIKTDLNPTRSRSTRWHLRPTASTPSLVLTDDANHRRGGVAERLANTTRAPAADGAALPDRR